MEKRRYDVALWLLPSSALPEIVACRLVDPWALPFEVVQALMRKRGETYVYKAVVSMGSWPPRRYWHVKLPLREEKGEQVVSVDEVVNQVWPLLLADGIDPVEVRAREALSLVKAEVSAEPDGLFACWCRAALASDVRVFVDRWNARRSAEVRYRLVQDFDS